MYVILGTK